MSSMAPMACHRSSPWHSRSMKVMQNGSSNTSWAVSKSTPCLVWLRAFFCSSQSNRTMRSYIVVPTLREVKYWGSASLRRRSPGCGVLNLYQRIVGMDRVGHFLQHGERCVILISAGEGSADRTEETAERAEGVMHGRGFVSAVHHAIGALRIAGLGPVLLP